MTEVMTLKGILDQIRVNGPDYLETINRQEPLPVVRGCEVLFLYDGHDEDVKEIRLIHHVNTLDRAPKLIPVDGSRIRALHLVLPRVARLEYTYGIRYLSGREDIRTDPRNPRVAWCPFGPKSVVMTGGYVTPEWSIEKEGGPKGSLEEHRIESTAFKDARQVLVYIPGKPPVGKKYPVLIVHDGTDYIHFAGLKTVLDNLIADGRMKPVIALLSRPGDRNEEYSCTPNHPVFISEELLPWARTRFSISSRRGDTALMGSSFGAIASVYTAYRYPSVFGLLLIQSGSFRFQDIVSASVLFEPIDPFDRIKLFLESEYFPKGPSRKMRIFQTCGTFEPMIGYNRNFYKNMLNLHHEIHYQTSHDGHNWISWRDHLGDGLPFLFPAKKSS